MVNAKPSANMLSNTGSNVSIGRKRNVETQNNSGHDYLWQLGRCAEDKTIKEHHWLQHNAVMGSR